MRVTEYNADGLLGWCHSFHDEETFEHNRREFIGYVLGEWSGADYYMNTLVNPPRLQKRPAQATTLIGTTLTNLPIPATIILDGIRYDVDDGEAEFDLPLPGRYPVRVEAWPYQDWEGEVIVPVVSGAEA